MKRASHGQTVLPFLVSLSPLKGLYFLRIIHSLINRYSFDLNVGLSRPLVELSFQIPRNAVIIAIIATGF